MDIYGEFGGGGGGGHTPREANDTLQSKQTVKLLFAVSEGEIASVEGVLLNEVAIDNYEAAWDWRPGTSNQTVIPGFTNTEEPLGSFAPSSVVFGLEYFASVPYDAAACRMTLTLQALKQVRPNGDVVAYTAEFEVYVRPSTSGIWSLIGNILKKGKASSPYSWDTKIQRPENVTIASNWEIKLVRLTPDDSDSKHISPSSWDSAIAIRESELTYPYTALVAITLTDAQQFGGRIPEVKFKIKGIKVKIPTNYDPITHFYTETPVWDGSLTESLFHYTANPAWHIYNILNNSRYALNILKADIDVISLYNLSKYADELVEDGFGGQERRYELHNQFYTRENSPTFLTYLLNICNANFTTNEFGQISIMFDRPGQAITKQVNNSNILDGQFSYSSSELESRYNLVNVTYTREQFKGRTDTATETENSLITRYGLQSSDIVLPGCTREGQAVRKARWAIYNSSFLPNLLSYGVLFSGLTYHVGELVKVFDNDNQGTAQTGLITSFSDNGINTTLVLDRQITLAAEAYTVSFLGEDGVKEEEHPTLETGISTNTLSFVGIVSPAVNSLFILSGSVVPKIYKIVKIRKEGENYQISCVEHSEAKYAYIDESLVLPVLSGDFVNISEFITIPVDSITLVENFSSNGVTQNSALEVTWVWVKGSATYTPNFKLTWKRDDQQNNLIDGVFGNTYDIVNPVPGIYEVTVWAINPFTGITSSPVVQTYDFRTVTTTSSLLPPENVFITGTSGLIFDSPDVNLSFTYDSANDNVSDSLKDYVIEVWNSTTTILKGTYIVIPNTSKGGLFTFSYSENLTQFGAPTRTFNLKVFSRDVLGDLSNPAIVQVTNNVPGLASFTLNSGSEATYVSITPPIDLDIAGFIVYRSETGGFTPAIGDIIYKGSDTYIALKGVSGTQYYYKVTVFDTFGETGLLITSQQSSTLLSSSVDVWIFSGLTFKPNDPINNRVSWTAGSASINGNPAVTLISGNTPWASGIRYIYYSGTGGALSTTDDLTIAVSGVQVLATYKGGTLLTVGNGNAFTDGGLILANTVGANQLVTNSAVITNTAQIQNLIVKEQHVDNGAITNLKIGNTIQSPNFSTVFKTGWKIDKTGNIISYGAMELREEGTGDLILTTGANAAIEWAKISGAGKPVDNADIANYGDSRITNIVEENATLTITRPVGASLNSVATVGIIKVILPTSWSNTMMKFTVDVFHFSSDKSFSLTVAGYNYGPTSQWLNTSVSLTGSIAANNRVRFGHDGSACVVYVGDIGTAWALSNTVVRDFQAGFQGVEANRWDDGWDILIENNETGFTLSPNADHPDALIDAKSITNQGALAVKSSVDLSSAEVTNKSLANVDFGANAKLGTIADNADVTGNNTAANIAGQGALAVLDTVDYGSLVSGTKPPSNATSGAVIGTNLSGTFTTNNIGVFMPSAAIGNLQFDRATGNKIVIAEADIGDLEVSTLKLAGNSVTIPVSASLAEKSLTVSAWIEVVSATIIVPAGMPMTIQIEAVSFPAGTVALGNFSLQWTRIRNYKLSRNGTDVGQEYSSMVSLLTLILSETLNPGTYTYTLMAQNVITRAGFSNSVFGNSIKLLGVKR